MYQSWLLMLLYMHKALERWQCVLEQINEGPHLNEKMLSIQIGMIKQSKCNNGEFPLLHCKAQSV